METPQGNAGLPLKHLKYSVSEFFVISVFFYKTLYVFIHQANKGNEEIGWTAMSSSASLFFVIFVAFCKTPHVFIHQANEFLHQANEGNEEIFVGQSGVVRFLILRYLCCLL